MTRILLAAVVSAAFFACAAPSQRYLHAPVVDIGDRNYRIDTSLASAPEAEILIEPFRGDLSDRVSAVIGHSDTDLTKGNPEGALGNFVTDLIRDYAALHASGADVCVMNNGGLRRDLPAGPITISTMYELMPFDNELVICCLDAPAIRAFAAELAKSGGEPISGMTIVADTGTGIVRSVKINDQDIDDQKIYRVATSDYIAFYGGDFPSLRSAKEIIRTGVFIRDILISHFKKNGTVSAGRTGRLIFKDPL